MPHSRSFEDTVDHLYQLPLDEFVAARTAAAREVSGADAATIRALQKPNLVAWGLNQLVWKDRPVFDRLVAAAAALRSAQSEALKGRAHDVRGATAEHREALRDAITQTARILEQAGHSSTPDTVRTLTAAFEALPWDDAPGRLVKPPSPRGFDVFAGMSFGEGGVPRRPSAARPSSAAATPAVAAEPKPLENAPPTKSKKPGVSPREEQRLERQREREAQRALQEARKAAKGRVEEARRRAAAAAQERRTSEGRVAKLRETERQAREELERLAEAVREAEAGQREALAAEQRAQHELHAAEEALARVG